MSCTAPLDQQGVEETEVRKTVTILFSDLVGSTALGERLDSESLREVMSRYFEEMRTILQRHGGTVEKFIGDAVMAVFGLPKSHEDDALRAVRAALEMRTALSRLNGELELGWEVTLSNRTGVNTGEVVAGDPTLHQRLVTGDAVNLAARLEQAAPHGEAFIGELTYRLTKDRVVAEPVEPLTLKGKSQRVPAYRLLDLVGVGRSAGVRGTRATQKSLIGRKRELDRLTELLERVSDDRQGHLVLVIGSPGVGKSRLVEAFLGGLEGRAHVLRGQCLSYGEGITFWPLREAVQSLIEDEDIEKELNDRLAGEEEFEEVIARLGSVVGIRDRAYPVDDLLWGVRRLLRALARERTVVLVFDDVQWGEATFLDMVERLREATTDEPILIVCLARPEFVEIRQEWARETGAGRSVLPLEPMGAEDSEQLMASFLEGLPLPEPVLDRLVTSAEGNPLFAQEMVAMLVDEGLLVRGGAGWEVSDDLSTLPIPPGIHALLAARLDGLVPAERSVLERGSVIGQVFYRGAVKELSPAAHRPLVDGGLDHLEATDYIRPDPGGFDGEDAFRFRHLLIRDAAYAGMLKRTRAALHEAFAEWLSTRIGDRISEYQEIVGYHFEQACRYLSELGPLNEHGRGLASDAAAHLLSAGNRARSRGDSPAAANLFARADALWREDDRERVAVLVELAETMEEVGDPASGTLVTRAEEAATRSGDAIAREYALMARLTRVLLENPEGEQQVRAEIKRIQPFLEQAGDHRGLARLWDLRRMLAWSRLQIGESEAAFREVIRYAGLSGDERLVSYSLGLLSSCAWLGPKPVSEAIEQCESLLRNAQGNRLVQSDVILSRAVLLAMRGEFEVARAQYRTGLAMVEEMELRVTAASMAQLASEVEMIAGDPAAAERELRRHMPVLIDTDNRWALPTSAGMLAMALYRQGRLDEAVEWSDLGRNAASSIDVDGQSRWRRVLALVLARRGATEEAERLSREAVQMFESSDYLNEKAQIVFERGEILALAGRTDQAATALAEALRGFERKGNLVSAEHARKALGELSPSGAQST